MTTRHREAPLEDTRMSIRKATIPRAACKALVPGLVFAFTVRSEAMAAYVGDYFFPSTLAITVPTAADFFNPPNFVLLPAPPGRRPPAKSTSPPPSASSSPRIGR